MNFFYVSEVGCSVYLHKVELRVFRRWFLKGFLSFNTLAVTYPGVPESLIFISLTPI